MDAGAIGSGMIFLAFIVLQAVLHGFLTALDEDALAQAERDAGAEAFEGLEEEKWKQLGTRMRPTGAFRAASVLLSGLFCLLFGDCLLENITDGLVNTVTVFAQRQAWSSGWIGAISLLVHYAVGVLLLLFWVTLGFLVPGKLARKNPTNWLNRTWRAAWVLCCGVAPVAWLSTVLAKWICRMFHVDYDSRDDSVTEQEIITMVNEGHEQGVLEADAAEMITNIFEYGDKEAVDIMTHRVTIQALNGEMTLQEAVHAIVSSRYSRFPVYSEDMDDIIGILHMKDALIALEQPGNREKPLKELGDVLRTPLFIPETRNIDDLLRSMQSQKIHMVIVLDEYGQTSGLITMEDILEEIVGNIFDEYDKEEVLIKTLEDGSYQMSGMAPLEEVAELLSLDLAEELEEFDTLNGFLIYRLDHIPVGEERPSVTVGDIVFEVKAVSKATITSVHVYKKLPELSQDSEDVQEKQ